jgi:hypothetical protein
VCSSLNYLQHCADPTDTNKVRPDHSQDFLKFPHRQLRVTLGHYTSLRMQQNRTAHPIAMQSGRTLSLRNFIRQPGVKDP